MARQRAKTKPAPKVKAQKVKETPIQDVQEIQINPAFWTNLKQRSKIKYKNDNQERFADQIEFNEITICTGAAGTGKTFLALMKALNLLADQENGFSSITLIKPAVEAGENLGFLPGDEKEKLAPYIYSFIYILEKALGKNRVEKLIERKIIDVRSLAFLRGVTLDNTIVIFDEMQNSTPAQIKTLLTRIGKNCKFILLGDLEQSDKFSDPKKTGLYAAVTKLKNVDGIGIFEFQKEDIVRNPIISKILKALND